MKSLRYVQSLLIVSAAAFAFAQGAQQQSASEPATAPKAAAAGSASQASATPSEAQQAFKKLKTLDGTWEGKVTADIPIEKNPLAKEPMVVTLRTTSRGNALMHEMTSKATPDDPITMFYLDGDQLMLTHYCDAGNRPRMVGKISPDGNSIEFEFTDVTGNMKYGHMHHAKITFIDADHHTEDWTFMVPKGAVHAHFDLHRTKSADQQASKG